MAFAAILSLEEFRDARQCIEIRQRLHDRFDHWLDKLEERMIEAQPTQAAFGLRQEWAHVVTEGLVEQVHRANGGAAHGALSPV